MGGFGRLMGGWGSDWIERRQQAAERAHSNLYLPLSTPYLSPNAASATYTPHPPPPIKAQQHPNNAPNASKPANNNTHPNPPHKGIVTTPLDVLKTRLMTQGASGRYKNLLDATLQIAKTEGWAAFMSGWQPRLIWISLGGFVFFPALEAAKELFGPGGGLLTPPSTELVIEELEAKDLKRARASKEQQGK